MLNRESLQNVNTTFERFTDIYVTAARQTSFPLFATLLCGFYVLKSVVFYVYCLGKLNILLFCKYCLCFDRASFIRFKGDYEGYYSLPGKDYWNLEWYNSFMELIGKKIYRYIDL